METNLLPKSLNAAFNFLKTLLLHLGQKTFVHFDSTKRKDSVFFIPIETGTIENRFVFARQFKSSMTNYFSMALVLLSLIFVDTTNAQGTLGRWQMCGLSGSTGSVSATGTNANTTFSTLTRGSGLSSSSATDGYRSSGFSTSSSLTTSNNDYYEFTITPGSGYKISLAALKIRDQRSTDNSSFDAYLRFSDDGYASNVVASWLPSTTLTNRTLDLSGVTALQNRTTAITFRIYATDSNNTSDTYGFFCEGTNSGNFRGIDVDGTAVALPTSIGRWQMCGLSGSTGSVSATGTNANTTFSTLTRGSGLSSSSATDGYRSSGFSTSSSLTTSNNDYYEFTITPGSGYKISLAALKIRDQRSTDNSSFDAYLRFSDDGYASNVVASWLPSTTLTNRTLDLSGVTALQNRTTAITFRIYGSDSNSTSDTYGFFCQGTNPSDFKGIDFEGNVIALGSSTISVTGSTSFNYNGSNQGPTTSSVTGSTGAVTYSYSGTGATSYSASATRPTNAGTYQVIATLAADSNYNGAVSSPFAFTINKASLTITANNVNKTYGATLTGGSGSTAFTPSGLQNGQTIGTVTIAYGTGAAATAAVATYTGSVTPSAATGGTFTANNYDITYATGNIIVGKANLTITANDVNKTYGATLTGGAGSTAFTSSALQNSETIGSVTIAYGSGAASNAAVGTYSNAVTPSAATGGTFNTNNYNINYATGDIIVNPGAFVKLQLLLPGETAAPGTGSGKTGTPTSRTSGVAFNVTVNAVDAFWNVVPTALANTIAISSSDGVAILPSNATLSSGTRNFSVTLKTVGSATVTATNVTNGLITANTSPSVTVTPGIKTTNGDGNWSDPNTWSPVGVPYFSDQVYILDADDVTVTANATCASINFTDENSSLSVNSGITLTVTGAVTLNSYNDDTDTSAEILGNGTLNAGSLNVGLASTLNNDDGSDNTLVIGIAVLNVTGDITMYNNDEDDGDANEPELFINPPCVLSASKVAMIQTGDGDGGSRIITFDVDNGATVNLSGGPNPITISSEVDLDFDHVNFALGSSSTINYNGSVIQNIPASISNSRSGGDTDSRVPVNYGNLTINNNTGTTTTDATGRTINVAGNWTNNGVFTSTGSTVNFTGNGAQAITGTNTTTFNDVTIAKTGGTLTVNTDATVADDLTFTASSGTLSVSNSKTLNIADNLILNNNANNSVTASITGSGTLLASTVIVGPALNPNNNSTRTTTLNSSVSTFTVSNDLEINSYYNGGNKRNNGVFNLQSGVLTINGEINTTNENSGNTSTFSMASGAESGLLKLTAASPFNLSGQGTNTINLNGTSAVVEYMGSVNQNALGTTYRTLLINNSNTGVTLSGNATAATLDLTDGLLTTGSNVMTIASGGTILNASTTTYVNGKLARVLTNTNDFTYPVGKGGVYSPVVFTYAATPGTKTVTIEQFETGSPFSSPSISTTTFGTRYWNITQSAIGTSYRVGLNDRGNTPVGSVVMLRKDNASITYNNPTTYSAPNYSNSNAFSATVVSNDVALGETAIPLYITGVTGINTKMYDGNAIATAIGTPVLAGTILSGETVTLSGTPVYTFNTKNVGTGKAVTVSGLVLTGASAGAYSLPTNQIPGLSGDIIIRPLEITANANTKVFDNTINVFTLPSITSGAIQGTDTFGFISTYDNKNVGNNKTITPSGVVIDGNGGNNYAVTFVSSTTGEITPKSLTISGATTSNKVYDGNEIATLTGGTLVGIISPNVVNLNKSAIYASKDAGNWTITSTSTISGADAGNYFLIQPTLTSRTITKAPLTASLIGTITREYNGNTNATLSSANYSLSGLISPDVYGTSTIYVFDTSGAYDTKNVGTSKNVTVTSLNLAGPQAGNYSISNAASVTGAIGNITAKDITASVVGVTKEYDTNANTLSLTPANFSFSGKVNGDDITVSNTITNGTYNNANVGTSKPVTVTNLVFSGADKDNYTVTNAASVTSNTGVITRKALTASLTGTVSKIYNGNINATLTQANYILSGVVSPDVDGVAVYVTDTSGAYDTKNVGTAKDVTVTTLTLGGPQAGNYSISNAASVTGAIGAITAKDITASVVGVTKEYDTTADTPSLTPANFSFSGVVGGDDITVSNTITSGTYNNANVGTSKPVTVTNLVFSGADKDNYTVTNAASVTSNTGVITRKALTASLTGTVSKIYNGNINATLTQANYILSGVVSPDVDGVAVYVTDTSGAYDTKNVGTAKDVTVTTLTLGGPQAGNYSISNAASVTGAIGAITAKDITASVVGVTKEYDTTADTPSLTPANFSFSGVVGGDDITVSNTITSGTYNNANVGTSKPVTVTNLVFSGADKDNYTVTNAASVTSNTGVITRKALTASLTGTVSKEYNGNINATLTQANYILSGVVSPDVDGVAVYVTDTSGAYDTKNVGTSKNVTVTTLTLGGPQAGNYTIGNAASVTGAIGEITARDLTVSLRGTISKAYDGTTVATLSPAANYTLTGLVSGDDVTVTNTSGAYDTKDFGTLKPVTVTTIVLSGADVANYNFTNPSSVTGNVGTISRVVLTASLIGTVSKAYDGNTNATLSVGNYSLSAGVVGSEDVTVFKANGSYDTKFVGTGKTVSVSSLSLSGTDAANYTLSSSSASGAVGEITARPLTITAGPQSICQGSSISQTIFSTSGLLSGDSVTAVTLTQGATTITPSNATGTGLGNYAIDYVDGVLTTNPLPTASIAVNNATQCLNQLAPIVTFTGLVGTAPFIFTYNRTSVINGVTTTLTNLTSTGTVSVPVASSGVYTYTLVSVQDANTCSQAQSGLVTVTIGACTQIRSTQCGRTLTSINTLIEADAIPGATAYRFELVRTDNPADIRYVTTNATPKINPASATQLPGGLLYNKSYNIRVQAFIGSWLAYGRTCVVTTPQEPLVLPTYLSSNFCGKVLPDVNTSIECQVVYQATAYEFEVRAGAGNGGFMTKSFVSPTYYFGFYSGISGVQYNKAYIVRVRAFSQGAWTAWGPDCTIYTPNVPQTFLLSTNNSVSGCSRLVNTIDPLLGAYEVRLAERYKFRVKFGVNTVEVEKIGSRYFSGNDFKTAYAPGYQYSTAYTIDVDVMYDGQWQNNWGPLCTITTPAPPIARMTDAAITNVFEVSAFPNPFARHFSLDIQSSSDDLVQVRIFDMIGRELEVQKATVSELSTKEIGTNYPSGVYNVVVSQGKESKTVRMIKR